MKIAILGNQARAMSNFWTVLIRRLKAAGHDVLCIVPSPGPDDDPAWELALLSLGVRLVRYPLDRKGLNPKNDLKTLLFLRRLFMRDKPDVLFASTIKPVIYGAFAAFLAGYPAKEHRHVMITGLGYMFEGDSFVKRILMQVARLLYRMAFSCVQTVFFQNEDDRALFASLGILPKNVHVAMSKGTGVDIKHFAWQESTPAEPRFLYVGRLLEAKGLRDLYGAAKILKKKYPHVTVAMLGPEEKGPGGIPLAEVKEWQQEGVVEYLGETRDVRPFLATAGVVVLPSWREGTPCSLMEAMSMGRALIAADAPGSREVVRSGENGFLVPVKNPEALAAAMEQFILDPLLASKMGGAGRKLAEEEFSAEVVAAGIMKDMGLAVPTAEGEAYAS